MRAPSLVTGLAVALVNGLAVGVPAAHADRWVGTDPAGDPVAWQWSPDDLLCGGSEVESADAGGEDITDLVVRHQPRKLVFRLKYDAPTTTTHRSVDIHVRTPRRDLVVSWYADGPWRLTVGPEMEFEPWPIDSDGDGETDCDGWVGSGTLWRCPGHEVDPADRSLTIAVPRSCLDDPRWVRVGAEGWGDSVDDESVSIHDEWGTAEPTLDPNVHVYGERVRVSPGQKGVPSKRSRVTNSETSWRRSLVISRTGFPIGTTAATAY